MTERDELDEYKKTLLRKYRRKLKRVSGMANSLIHQQLLLQNMEDELKELGMEAFCLIAKEDQK